MRTWRRRPGRWQQPQPQSTGCTLKPNIYFSAVSFALSVCGAVRCSNFIKKKIVTLTCTPSSSSSLALFFAPMCYANVFKGSFRESRSMLLSRLVRLQFRTTACAHRHKPSRPLQLSMRIFSRLFPSHGGAVTTLHIARSGALHRAAAALWGRKTNSFLWPPSPRLVSCIFLSITMQQSADG